MKTHTQPKHDKQSTALSDIKYLMDAANAIHRATDGDSLPTSEIAHALGWKVGWNGDEWTEKANHPDTKAAIEHINWLLYDKNGKAWSDHCGPLKTAIRAVLREAKKRITDTDWTPCTCKECKKRNK